MALKVINVLLVIIYALGSGIWVSTGDAWYRALNTPSWQPPDWVFGTIWPYNFIILGIAGWITISNLGKSWGIVWLAIFALSIFFALSWARLFYISHNLGAASLALGFVALLTIPLLAMTFKSDWRIGLLLTPYQLWVATATALSYSYFKLN